jgi:hypothetical protein
MTDEKFLYSFSKDILGIDSSIRWVDITGNTDVLLNIEYREGLKLLCQSIISSFFIEALVNS